MSYNELRKLVGGRKLPISATNENGENVIIEEGSDNELGHFYRTETAQHNNWCRINYYYENGDTEELYEH